MDVCVNLDAAFLLSRLRMASSALEEQIREQSDRRGIDNLQLVEPLGSLTVPPVRQNDGSGVKHL